MFANCTVQKRKQGRSVFHMVKMHNEQSIRENSMY